MTKNEIIAELARNKTIETLMANITKGHVEETHRDIIQDMYVDLLSKPEELIQNLYEKKQMNFFLVRMLTNNLYSVNSRAYYNYGKYEHLKSDNNILDIPDDEN